MALDFKGAQEERTQPVRVSFEERGAQDALEPDISRVFLAHHCSLESGEAQIRLEPPSSDPWCRHSQRQESGVN
jgi:hypothetical protein